jgi:orotate phosphoribosyltransferase
MNNERGRLLEVIKRLSYEEGEFILKSGKRSSFYIDARETTLNPEGMYLTGQIIYRMVHEFQGIDAVGGVSVGADPLVCATVMTAYHKMDRLLGFFIRKEPKGHGRNLWIEGAKNLTQGMEVIILEDVVTTGGSSLRAIEITEAEGYKVRAVIALIDRLEGGKDAIESRGYRFMPIFNLTELRRA